MNANFSHFFSISLVSFFIGLGCTSADKPPSAKDIPFSKDLSGLKGSSKTSQSSDQRAGGEEDYLVDEPVPVGGGFLAGCTIKAKKAAIGENKGACAVFSPVSEAKVAGVTFESVTMISPAGYQHTADLEESSSDMWHVTFNIPLHFRDKKLRFKTVILIDERKETIEHKIGKRDDKKKKKKKSIEVTKDFKGSVLFLTSKTYRPKKDFDSVEEANDICNDLADHSSKMLVAERHFTAVLGGKGGKEDPFAFEGVYSSSEGLLGDSEDFSFFAKESAQIPMGNADYLDENGETPNSLRAWLGSNAKGGGKGKGKGHKGENCGDWHDDDGKKSANVLSFGQGSSFGELESESCDSGFALVCVSL